MTDPPKLGHLVEGWPARDAVHVAIVSVKAAVSLAPGQPVTITNGEAGPGPNPVGVVDPFLAGAGPRQGERFWLLLYPGTVTSLRHEWSHPAFPLATDGDRAASEKWLREFAATYHEWGTFEQLIEMAIAGDIHLHGSDSDDGVQELRESSSSAAEFWQHLSVFTGRVFSAAHVENTVVSCGC